MRILLILHKDTAADNNEDVDHLIMISTNDDLVPGGGDEARDGAEKPNGSAPRGEDQDDYKDF